MTASAFFLRNDRSRSPSDSGIAEVPGTIPIPAQNRAQRLLVSFAILISFAALIAAFGDVVRDIDYRATIQVLRHMPAAAIALAVVATAISFAALVGRDASALRYVGARPSRSALLIAGFCGSALGNAVGFGVLTSAAVRYRIYNAAGVKSDDVARLLAFVVGGFAIGLMGVGGLAGLVEAEPAGALLGWSPSPIRAVAGLALACVACLLALGVPKQIRLGGLALPPPSRKLIVAQLALTSVRLIGAAAALWVLLPATPVDFVTFVAIFSAATALAAVTHIPAGAGIFELIVLWAFRDRASFEGVAAALIAYRCIYYLLPLVLSSIAFAYFEIGVVAGSRYMAPDDKLARAAARLSPMFMSVIAFTTGVMLLISGATPTFSRRLADLSDHVPLWALESSHFLGSVIGVVFLFVARGLLDRRDGAWKLALALSASSLVFSLVKGLAFGEAAFLLLFAILLLATRQQFYRPTSMFDQPFTMGVVRGGRGHRRFGFRRSVPRLPRRSLRSARPMVAIRVRRSGAARAAGASRRLSSHCSPRFARTAPGADRHCAEAERSRTRASANNL